MKKIITLLLVLVLCAGFAACGKQTTPAEELPDPAPGESSEPSGGAETKPTVDDGTFLPQKELWGELEGMWFSKNEDGTVEFVSFSQEGSSYIVSTGQYLSDFFVRGNTTSYQPSSGTEYTLLCNMEINSMLSESGQVEYQTAELRLDVSRLKEEKVLVFSGAYVEELRAFEYAGATVEEYDAYYYDHMVDYSAG